MAERARCGFRVPCCVTPARFFVAVACLTLVLPGAAEAAREAKERSGADFEARRLFDKAEELIGVGEGERGVKMLETVVEQYPDSRVRYAAYLALGKYYINTHEQLKAVSCLANLKQLETSMGEVALEDRDVYLEGMFLMGTAHFQVRNYGAAFPILRKITNNFPNTTWANKAYYYIGMCHFVKKNWSKAIEALNLVGTFVDTDAGGSTELAEAGRRLYIKVSDEDLPVLLRLGRQTFVEIESSHGDKEKIEVIPLSADGDVLIGSAPTEVGVARAGDGVVQVLGGGTVTARYTDVNSRDGSPNVAREQTVRVVSSGAVRFKLGDLATTAEAAYLGQSLYISVLDADLDTSDAADSITVKLVARYREEKEEDGDELQSTVDLQRILEEEPEEVYRTRDEIVVRLAETGDAPVRSGRFAGSVLVRAATPDEPASPSDDVLSCVEGDEIVASFVDEMHLGGAVPRTVQASVPAVGAIDNKPRASQDVVTDAVVKSKKNLVEATAYLELARIFKSMGLKKGAKQKTLDGLERVDFIIRTSSPIPGDLREEAFKTKWELHLAADDFESAMTACAIFNRLYPDSPLVDQALMGIADIHIDRKQYAEAMVVLQQILALPKSQAKAEAQFRIAQTTELQSKGRGKGSSDPKKAAAAREASIQQYKLCAERYPDSEFAGRSLAKQVDYHLELGDTAQANELLSQVFQDHPDAEFLDSMLLKWVLVAYRAGDYRRAHEKCSQLLFEYPDSPYAAKAKQILPKLEAKLNAVAAPAVSE